MVAFFEGADGDVAVLPKPLILNPAGTEGQVLINAPGSRNASGCISVKRPHDMRASSGDLEVSSLPAFAVSSSKLLRSKASSNASRVGKWPYSVPSPTPALRAMSRSVIASAILTNRTSSDAKGTFPAGLPPLD